MNWKLSLHFKIFIMLIQSFKLRSSCVWDTGNHHCLLVNKMLGVFFTVVNKLVRILFQSDLFYFLVRSKHKYIISGDCYIQFYLNLVFSIQNSKCNLSFVYITMKCEFCISLITGHLTFKFWILDNLKIKLNEA